MRRQWQIRCRFERWHKAGYDFDGQRANVVVACGETNCKSVEVGLLWEWQICCRCQYGNGIFVGVSTNGKGSRAMSSDLTAFNLNHGYVGQYQMAKPSPSQ